jgi:putative phosphoribosyl transferase
MFFPNRWVAGRRLAERLGSHGDARPIVLALPRGGVPVGYEVARALDAPLDVLVVRKVGAPGNPEFAIGAVGPNGVTVLDGAVIDQLHVSAAYLEDAIGHERMEVEHRQAAFRGGEPWPDLTDRTAIIVDDGIATGATAEAAVQAARTLGAHRVIVAAPVVSPQSAARLRQMADEVVSLLEPMDFVAVGYWYEDFSQTTEDEVRMILRRARAERSAGLHAAGPAN